VHITALRGIETSVVSTEEVIGKVSSAFHDVAYRAVQLISRIAYTDLQESLLEFETLWIDPAKQVVKKITSKLAKVFDSIRVKMEEKFYLLTLSFCADTCVMRVLLLLKNRAARNSRFTTEEVSRLELDAVLITKCFSDAKALAESDELVASLLSCQMSYLLECCDLLRVSIEEPAFMPLMKRVVGRYVGQGPEYVDAACNLLSALVGTLRPDAGPITQGLVNTVVDEVESKKRQITAPNSRSAGANGGRSAAVNDTASDDLIYRSFGNRHTAADVRTSQSASSSSSSASSSSSSANPSSRPPLIPMTSLRTLHMRPAISIKNLREKAADFNVMGTMSGAAARRKNEEQATQVMRVLGLEDGGGRNNDCDARARVGFLDDSESAVGMGNGSSHGKRAVGGGAVGGGAVGGGTATEGSEMGSDAGDDGDDGRFSRGGRDRDRDNASEMESQMSASTVNFNAGAAELDNITDPCMLSVSGIHVKDLKSSSLFGGANPYVAVTLGNQRQKTKVKWNRTEAQWQDTILSFKSSKSRLESYRLNVSVFDKERVRRKRTLGSVSIRLAGVELRKIEGWFVLEGGVAGSSGAVYLCIEAFM
jgi:hypothetical protein